MSICLDDSCAATRLPGDAHARTGTQLRDDAHTHGFVMLTAFELSEHSLALRGLAEACSSLHAFCVQRLGYSENEAQRRIQVARLYQRLPQVLAELENGSIHLTGLFALSAHLSESNATALLGEARGKARRQIEAILARWFPRSDVLPSITPVPAPADDLSLTIPGNETPSATAGSRTPTVPAACSKSRLAPLSATSYRVEFTAGAALHDKIEQARNLLGHALPNGDLARLFERALDALLDAETKRRLGAAKPRRQRALSAGSRHVPVQVARGVWRRDCAQSTFVDAEGQALQRTALSRARASRAICMRRPSEHR